jgi:hypothetical protein
MPTDFILFIFMGLVKVTFMEQVPCERFSETEAIQFSETEDTGF